MHRSNNIKLSGKLSLYDQASCKRRAYTRAIQSTDSGAVPHAFNPKTQVDSEARKEKPLTHTFRHFMGSPLEQAGEPLCRTQELHNTDGYQIAIPNGECLHDENKREAK